MTKLKIENERDMMDLIYQLKKARMIDDVAVRMEDIPLKYPVEVPIDMTGLIGMLDNPMVKPFRKRICQSFSLYVNRIQRALA